MSDQLNHNNNITIFCDGREQQLPAGSSGLDIISSIKRSERRQIVAMQLNNQLCSLTQPITSDGRFIPVFKESLNGSLVCRKTLTFLLFAAAAQLFKSRRLIFSHSVKNSYFFYFADGVVTADQFQQLEVRLQQIIAADKPIERREIDYAQAKEIFADINESKKLFIEFYSEPTIPCYFFEDYSDYSLEAIAPSTGLADNYQLLPFSHGIMLRFPNVENGFNIDPFDKQDRLLPIFDEYERWGEILNIDCVGKLNRLIADQRIDDFIKITEALHEEKISAIAKQIKQQRQRRITLIAGPSSSGKTTFCKKLSIHLRSNGLKTEMISLDDYYLDHRDMPRDANGNMDFELLNALDIEKLNRDLSRLLDGCRIELPDFDFTSGRSRPSGRVISLNDNTILLIEGIHALNERLTAGIDCDKKFMVYISALTQLNIDDSNRISTTDNRLLRRILRDSQFRNHTPLQTLRRWSSVTAGERGNIFPFQQNADAIFNSALDYELAALKPIVTPLLRTIKPDEEEFTETTRLLDLLASFISIPESLVPGNSILREFLGSSDFKY